MDLQHLADRAAISDVVIAYATGIDRRDWALYRSIFTDPVHIDFSSFSGGSGTEMAREDWVQRVRGLQDGFDATQHLSTNHVVRLDAFGPDGLASAATCVSEMHAQHYVADQPVTFCTLGGHYTNQLVRTPDGWRIRSCTLTVRWETGTRAIFPIALDRAPGRRHLARSD